MFFWILQDGGLNSEKVESVLADFVVDELTAEPVGALASLPEVLAASLPRLHASEPIHEGGGVSQVMVSVGELAALVVGAMPFLGVVFAHFGFVLRRLSSVRKV